MLKELFRETEQRGIEIEDRSEGNMKDKLNGMENRREKNAAIFEKK